MKWQLLYFLSVDLTSGDVRCQGMSLRLRHCGRREQGIIELPLFMHARSGRSTLSESLLLRVSRLSRHYHDYIFFLHLKLIPICSVLPLLFAP